MISGLGHWHEVVDLRGLFFFSEANMNESTTSDDVGLIQSSTSTKPKNPDIWKHLK